MASRSKRNNDVASTEAKKASEAKKRHDDEEEEDDEENGLNRRGVPARKRKRNSLIYGQDDLVSIPVKSPKKKGHKNSSETSTSSAAVSSPAREAPKESPKKTPKVALSANSSPSKTSPKKRLNFDEPPKSENKTDESPVKRPGSAQLTPKKSPKKKVKQEQGSDLELSTPEKVHAQSLGVALRNLLKLPKAHKWVCYEFFYSNLDKILFDGENDFMVCLKESFPQIKTRRLTRVEWCKIRRMMGKPRRCSAAFFAEERAELARKRNKIRLLQQRKQNEILNFKDLPDTIPLQISVGSRVTAKLRRPQDGLFMGVVDAYDTSNNTYRIRFDRFTGRRSVKDEEVLSVEPPETVPLSSFMQRVIRRPQPLPPQSQTYNSVFASPVKGVQVAPYGSSYSPQLAGDPMLSGGTPRVKIMQMDGQVGGYPVKFLEQIVRLSKILKKKRAKIAQLRDLNTEGERKKSFGDFISEDFQRRYASNVIDLSNINRDLGEHIKNIQDFTQEFALEAGPTISMPNIIREGCQEDAYDMVNKNNSAGDYVENPKTLALISSFTALMLHIKQLSDGERNSFELEALQHTLRDVKKSISTKNADKFENCVEVHMNRIQSGLSQMGNLHAFMKSTGSTPKKDTPAPQKVNSNNAPEISDFEDDYDSDNDVSNRRQSRSSKPLTPITMDDQ